MVLLAWYASRGQSFEVQKQNKGPRWKMMILFLPILLSRNVHCAQVDSIGWVSQSESGPLPHTSTISYDFDHFSNMLVR